VFRKRGAPNHNKIIKHVLPLLAVPFLNPENGNHFSLDQTYMGKINLNKSKETPNNEIFNTF
jgi:hypothetical protein